MEVCSQEFTVVGYTLPNREDLVPFLTIILPLLTSCGVIFQIRRAIGTKSAVRIPQRLGGEFYKTGGCQMGLLLQRDCS